MKPKVSVVVPIYNAGKYLRKCLNSVAQQTLKDIEIILIDDGSTDDSAAICDEYASKDDRVKVFHKDNEGVSAARNLGIEQAKGEYLSFVDDDDHVDLWMLESLYKQVKKNNADAVFCGYRKQVKLGYESKIDFDSLTCVSDRKMLADVALDMIAPEQSYRKERKRRMSIWGGLVSKKILNENNILFLNRREVGSEDLLFKLDLFLKGKKIVFMPDVFYTWCWHRGTTLSHQFQRGQYFSCKKVREILIPKVDFIQGSRQRINRFFMLSVRSCLYALWKSDISFEEKKQYLKEICNDYIWDEISKEYNPPLLPLVPKLIYFLICRKQVFLLVTMLWGLKNLKSILGKRD